MACDDWDLDAYNLALTIARADAGHLKLERAISDLFGLKIRKQWTRRFEAAVELFEQEFGRERGDWSRQCLAKGCNGISWISPISPAPNMSGETDALAPCCAMVRAKRAGAAIASSTVAAFRERGALLPAIDTIERIGLAGRAIASQLRHVQNPFY